MGPLEIKDKHALIDLAKYGTVARKKIHPDLLIGNYPPGCGVFKEGDILDANATLNLIRSIPQHNNNSFKCECKQGPQGQDGESAYEIAVKNGFSGTEEEWLTSLKGDTGETGPQGDVGHKGDKGDPFAYEDFTPEQLELLTGPLGPKGDTGETGPQGPQGLTGNPFAYEDFTPEQLLALKGDTGAPGSNGTDGQTPYIGMNGNWFIGDTDTQVKAQGEKGADGEVGAQGPLGPLGEQGAPFEIYRSYNSVSDMVSDAENVPENKFVLVANAEDPNNGELYIRKSTSPDGFEFIVDMATAVSIQGPQGLQGIQGEKGDKGDKGDTGVGIKSMLQTVISTENGGINTFTFTLDNNRSALFNIRNGSTDTSDIYTKDEINNLLRLLLGYVTVRKGLMTTITAGTEQCPVYLSYVSMDKTTADKIASISYIYEDQEQNTQQGYSLLYYTQVIFGNTTLNNVWCTPIQEIPPINARYYAFVYDINGLRITEGDRYNHVFLQENEYQSLRQYDDNTIYFIWDNEEAQDWTFPGTFPITLGGSDNTFPIILT